MAEPGMFFVPERYEWVDCDVGGYEGLRALIRVNLRNFERTDLIQARIDGPLGTVKALEMARPWVRDWNVFEADDDGNAVKVAPPAEQGMDAYMRLDPRIAGWLLDAIQNAFRGGKGLSGSPRTSEGSPELGTGQNADEPPATTASSSPRGRRSSSSPKPSTTATTSG